MKEKMLLDETDEVSQTPSKDTEKEVRGPGREDEGDSGEDSRPANNITQEEKPLCEEETVCWRRRSWRPPFMEREEETDDVTHTPSNDTEKEVRCRGREDEGDTRSCVPPFMEGEEETDDVTQTPSNDTEKEVGRVTDEMDEIISGYRAIIEKLLTKKKNYTD